MRPPRQRPQVVRPTNRTCAYGQLSAVIRRELYSWSTRQLVRRSSRIRGLRKVLLSYKSSLRRRAWSLPHKDVDQTRHAASRKRHHASAGLVPASPMVSSRMGTSRCRRVSSSSIPGPHPCTHPAVSALSCQTLSQVKGHDIRPALSAQRLRFVHASKIPCWADVAGVRAGHQHGPVRSEEHGVHG